MVDTQTLAAFVLVTGMTSLVPGPSMLLVLGQAIWRGGRSGVAALIGVQFGYVVWWMLAALGLGTLAATFPLAFRLLAIAGAAYLAWLGLMAMRRAGNTSENVVNPQEPSRHAFRDGILVAIGNPKALIYIVALLPPFVDAGQPIVPQLAVLATVAIVIDLFVGSLYVILGNRLARIMTRIETGPWFGRVVGAIFLTIAVAIMADLLFGATARS